MNNKYFHSTNTTLDKQNTSLKQTKKISLVGRGWGSHTHTHFLWKPLPCKPAMEWNFSTSLILYPKAKGLARQYLTVLPWSCFMLLGCMKVTAWKCPVSFSLLIFASSRQEWLAPFLLELYSHSSPSPSGCTKAAAWNHLHHPTLLP